MKKLISLFVLFLILNVNSANSQDNIISAHDFSAVLGSGWQGNLTYLDYTSGKSVTIPVNLSITQLNDISFELSLSFPNEPQANSSDTIHILNDGTYLDGKKILSVKKSGSTTIITAESTGEDNNKPASFKYTYILNSNEFSITKEVNENGSANYFVRNKYLFNRN